MNDFTISAGFLFTIVLFGLSVMNFITARKASNKTEVENTVKINVKLDEICRTTTETRSDIKSTRNDIQAIQAELIKQKMFIEQLQKEVDVLKHGK